MNIGPTSSGAPRHTVPGPTGDLNDQQRQSQNL